MTKTYSYDLSIKDLTKLQKDLDRIPNLLQSEDFKRYIGERLQEALKFVQRNLVKNIADGSMQEEMSIYMNSNHLEIQDDIIYIYNDATIDVASKNMKETTKAKYPAQLSLAKIIEYGIGWVGKDTPHQEEVEDWVYDMNNHQEKGWYFIDENGQLRFSKGYQGRMIFYHLKEFVEAHIGNWINDYLNEKL